MMNPDRDQKDRAAPRSGAAGDLTAPAGSHTSLLPDAAARASEQTRAPSTETARPPVPGSGKPDLGAIYRKDKILIAHSAVAGGVSFPISWAVCALAKGNLAAPAANAALGVAVSLGVYLGVFYALSLWRSRQTQSAHNLAFYTGKFMDCLKVLGLKEVAEMGLRYGLHTAGMAVGLPAAIASPIAQLISGGAGHLAVPLFANIGKFFRRA